MKAVTAILFTVLYTVFSAFAVTGFAASKCFYTSCKDVVTYGKQKGIIVITDEENCTHNPAVSTHIFHKQINNAAGGGNKWLSSNFLPVYRNSFYSIFINSGKLSHKTVAIITCPIFIRNCAFLI